MRDILNKFDSIKLADILIAVIEFILYIAPFIIYGFKIRKVYPESKAQGPLFLIIGVILTVFVFIFELTKHEEWIPFSFIVAIFIAFIFIMTDYLKMFIHDVPLNKILMEFKNEQSIKKYAPPLCILFSSFSDYLEKIFKTTHIEKEFLSKLIEVIHFKDLIIDTQAEKILFSLDTDKYVKFLEKFFDLITSYKYSIRIFSLYQPYEWFHNSISGRVTLLPEIEQYINFCWQQFSELGENLFCRYILTNKNLVEEQQKLKIILNHEIDKKYLPFDNYDIACQTFNNFKNWYVKSYPNISGEYITYDINKKFYPIYEERYESDVPSIPSYTKLTLFEAFDFGITKLVYDEQIHLTDNRQIHFASTPPSWTEIQKYFQTNLRNMYPSDITLIKKKDGHPLLVLVADITEGDAPDKVAIIMNDNLLNNINKFIEEDLKSKNKQTLPKR